MLSTNDQTHKMKKLIKPLVISSFLTLALTACDDNDDVTPIEMTAEEMQTSEITGDMTQATEMTETSEMPAVMEMPAETMMEYSYSIKVTNLTYAQPLSPIAVALHGDSKLWQVGSSASVALEKLAEAGDNKDFLALEGNTVTTSTDAPLGPGSSVNIDIMTTSENHDMAKYLTIATMLVNTNDAFSGLTGVDISTLMLNEEKSWSLNVYDAGTEANTEVAGTIPGPADGGIGFDVTREDSNLVSYHSGVISQDDGLSNSVLTQEHRFDNPAVKLTITRTK